MPNGLDKVNIFVPKVYDHGRKRWMPLYIPPDATETVKGMVFLADNVGLYKDYDAEDGMTAVTPAGVYKVQYDLENSIKKASEDLQKEITEIKGSAVTGVKGNAETEYRKGTVNLTPANIGAVATVKQANKIYGTDSTPKDVVFSKVDNKNEAVSESERTTTIPSLAYFDSKMTATIVNDNELLPTSKAVYDALRNLDASWLTNGTIPLDRIPQAAMERLVKVATKADMLKLTKDDVQKGDTVLCLDTNIMYVVVDDTKLNSEAGYQEYKAGSAAKASVADVANSVEWNNVQNKVVVSSTTSGLMTPEMLAKLEAASTGTYELPLATNSVRGGFQTGFVTDNDSRNYAVQMSGEKAYVNVPWQGSTYGNATATTAGLMSPTDKAKLDGLENYVLPVASNVTRGGVKVGYTANGKNYPVQLSNEQMYVNVPWTDTNTTYSAVTSSANGLMTPTMLAKLNNIAENANNYSLPTASSSTKGGVKVGKGLSISSGVLSVTLPVVVAQTLPAANAYQNTVVLVYDGGIV